MINTSSEQFFGRRLNRRRTGSNPELSVLEPAPAEVATLAKPSPEPLRNHEGYLGYTPPQQQLRSPQARALAASGFPALAAMQDYAYIRQEEQAGKSVPNLELYSIMEDSATTNPLPSDGMSNEELIRAQLAGDTFGDVNRFLKSRTVMPDPFGLKPRDQAMLDAPLIPYKNGSFGKLDSDTAPSRLDRNIYDDKYFKELLAKDPVRARHLYRRLKGRELDEDLQVEDASSKAIRQRAVETASRLFSTGDAKPDPLTGTWLVRQRYSVPDPIDPTKTVERVGMFPANEYENKVLSEYAPLFGIQRDDWSKLKETKGVLQSLHKYAGDERLKSLLDTRAQLKGSPLHPDEIEYTIREYEGALFTEATRPGFGNKLLGPSRDIIEQMYDYLIPKNSDGSWKTRDQQKAEAAAAEKKQRDTEIQERITTLPSRARLLNQRGMTQSEIDDIILNHQPTYNW